MAYFNGFPATYPQYYPQFQQNQPGNTQNQQNGIIWVQGEAGAKSYLVAPNNTVQLWDSESQTIYLKSADASGMPSMKILDYTIRNAGNGGANQPVKGADDKLSGYATKSEIDAVSCEIEALKKRLDEMTKEGKK